MQRTISDLSPTEFENLVFDLVQSLGLKNAIWRTPGRDAGRDIEGQWFNEDLSGHISSQIWYVECKRYGTSVSWPTVWEKISFAESSAADVLLFTVSSSLSPQAVDEVNKWNSKGKTPRIRFWNGFDIETKLQLLPLLQIKYGLAQDSRIALGGALLPVIDVLLKYSNAAHSAETFELDSSKKNLVIYSLAELLSMRIAEVGENGGFSTAPFRHLRDGFEWLENSELFEQEKMDRYAIRAIVCYIRDYSETEILHVSKGLEVIYIDIANDVSESALSDIREISLLSNFELSCNKNRISFKVR